MRVPETVPLESAVTWRKTTVRESRAGLVSSSPSAEGAGTLVSNNRPASARNRNEVFIAHLRFPQSRIKQPTPTIIRRLDSVAAGSANFLLAMFHREKR